MKKEDKAIFKGLKIESQDEERGCVNAYAKYDVRKLRRMEEFELEELLFQKTLDAYPFAVIERGFLRDGFGNAYVRVYIYIPEGARLRKVED